MSSSGDDKSKGSPRPGSILRQDSDPKPEKATDEPSTGSTSDGMSNSLPARSDSKKKPRLQWDEKNLMTNEREAARHPKMRIDEPKTPFHNGALSDAGSSTSGSVPQSPDAGPSVKFVEDHRLAGFEQLEQQYKTGGTSSAGARGSSASSGGVRVSVGGGGGGGGGGTASASGGAVNMNGSASESSTPRSREFERKRKLHYHGEFHRLDRSVDEISDSDGDEVERECGADSSGDDDESPGDRGDDGAMDTDPPDEK